MVIVIIKADLFCLTDSKLGIKFCCTTYFQNKCSRLKLLWKNTGNVFYFCDGWKSFYIV